MVKRKDIYQKDLLELVQEVGDMNDFSHLEYWEKDNSSGLTIKNTMRRIIENYFKILGKYGDDELIIKFHNQQEQEICRSLICWINDGSYGIPDDLFVEHKENTIENYNRVFENIFKETGHIEHYNMMMTLKN